MPASDLVAAWFTVALSNEAVRAREATLYLAKKPAPDQYDRAFAPSVRDFDMIKLQSQCLVRTFSISVADRISSLPNRAFGARPHSHRHCVIMQNRLRRIWRDSLLPHKVSTLTHLLLHCPLSTVHHRRRLGVRWPLYCADWRASILRRSRA